jgi:hypothetical protein
MNEKELKAMIDEFVPHLSSDSDKRALLQFAKEVERTVRQRAQAKAQDLVNQISLMNA